MTGTVTRLRRSLWATYIDTAQISTAPTYKLVGTGVTSGKETLNPKVEVDQYVNQDSGTSILENYAPTMPLVLTAMANEPVYEFVNTLRKNRKIMSDAETTIVNVDLYGTPSTTSTAGNILPAVLQSVVVAVDDYAGEGGAKIPLNATLHYQGLPTLGHFDIASTGLVFTTP